MQLHKCDPATHTPHTLFILENCILINSAQTNNTAMMSSQYRIVSVNNSASIDLSSQGMTRLHQLILSRWRWGQRKKVKDALLEMGQNDWKLVSSGRRDEWAEGWGMIIILWNWIVLDFQTRPDPNGYGQRKRNCIVSRGWWIHIARELFIYLLKYIIIVCLLNLPTQIHKK